MVRSSHEKVRLLLRIESKHESTLCRNSDPNCTLHAKSILGMGCGAIWRVVMGVVDWGCCGIGVGVGVGCGVGVVCMGLHQSSG